MKYKNILIIIIILAITILFLKVSNKKTIKESNETTKIVTTKKEVNSAKLTIVGDFLFEQPYYDAINQGEDKNKYFSLVKEYFTNDDLSIGNMEVVIGNESLKTNGTGYEFCAPQSIGYQIANLGMDVLSTANNHSYDRGIEGIFSTIDFFEKNSNILTVGTNKTNNHSNKILNINDIKFGFLSYASGTNKKVKDEDLYSINLYRNQNSNEITEAKKEQIKREVESLKKESDIVIVILHWGTEFTFQETEEQEELAEYLNSLGVDIIVGSHSHSIQPIKWIGQDEHKTLVYYSMGNFTSADDDISRAGEEFDNAYQVGLLSTLKITKTKNEININEVKTEPIINYYDENLKNFLIVPYSKYTNELEHSHYRYKYNLNKSFIERIYNQVISKDFR